MASSYRLADVGKAFSIPTTIAPNNGTFFHPKVITAYKQSSTSSSPKLLKEVIPHADLHVHEIVKRQSQGKQDSCTRTRLDPSVLEEAYGKCRTICAESAGSYYLGTLLMTEEQQKAIWAIYAWGCRIDDMVDGPNAASMSADLLDGWEARLQDIFNGHPHDPLDAALADSVSEFCLDIKPFKDLIEGMRMDTRKFRYANFQELYRYCYYVAGSISLLCVPVMGIASESSLPAQTIYDAAIYLAIGNQLTNILRDVWEDALLGRIYLPQDELARFGLCDEDVFARKVSDNWREFMKEQISRARFYYKLGEEVVSHLDNASRWPVWSALLLYQEILDAIEDNDYDNLTKRARVCRIKKLVLLIQAFSKAQSVPSSIIM